MLQVCRDPSCLFWELSKSATTVEPGLDLHLSEIYVKTVKLEKGGTCTGLQNPVTTNKAHKNPKIFFILIPRILKLFCIFNENIKF